MAVRPFLAETHPVLAGCSIRLSHRKDPRLQKLAEKAVATTTGSGPPVMHKGGTHTLSYPSFMDLPPELRLHILTYTDLVTPFREVEWNPSHGWYFRYEMPYCLMYRHPRDTHGSLGVNCPKSTSWWQDDTPYLACWERSDPSGCYCRAYHTAYSTIHRCDCWAPPKSIFLVSHAMRQDAKQVFFGHNRIIVAPTGGVISETVSGSPERLPISVFLTGIIPKDALRYLRFLELVFPPFGKERPCAFCPAQSTEWHDWNETLEKVKDDLNLPKLTIRVYFAASLPPFEDHGHEIVPSWRRQMTGVQSQAIQTSYLDTISPLKRLRGLGRFFAHLADPSLWVEGRELVEETGLPALEHEVERVVMGDWYDSSAAGKVEETWSRWLEDHG